MSEPTVTMHGDGYLFQWPETDYLILVDNIREKYNEPYAEISLAVREDSGFLKILIGPKSVGLMAPRALPAVAKDMATKAVGVADANLVVPQVTAMLEDAARLAMLHYRSGPPVIDLTQYVPDDASLDLRWLMAPLIPERQATLIVANGGSGKSLLGLTLASCVASGTGFPGIGKPMQSGPVLYLDWESDENDHGRRLGLIQNGLGISVPPSRLVYQKPKQEIRSCPWIGSKVAELRPALVVVDSVGYAMGGDLKEAGAVTEMFRVVNSWGVSTLLLHHQNREGEFYGSVYLRNSARSFWEMDSIRELHGLKLSLRQEKMNNGLVFPSPLGLRIKFETGQVKWEGLNVFETPDIAATMPLDERIKRVIEDARGALSQTEIAARLGVGEPSVRSTIKDYPWLFHVALDGGQAVVSLRSDSD